MSIETTPNLSLPLMIRNQSGKEVTHNEALVIIDVLLNNGIIDKDLSTPPVSPGEGDTYIVSTSATGDWATHEGKIAFYNNGWRFITPNEGFTVWINDENVLYTHNGTSWGKTNNENSSLDNLSDVIITTPTQYDLLSYNGTNFVNTQEIQVNNLTLSGLTASKIVETNISKKLISANKNTAYNKNFGIISDTVCEGNDSRLSDSRTPTVHNLAGAEHNTDTIANLNLKISDATLIDTSDSRLSNSRKCDNTFDNITTTKTNLLLNNVDNTSDINKPVSTAQQTALDLKANDNEVVKLTGNQSIVGEKDFTTGIKIASSALLNSVSTGIADNNKIATKGYVDDNENPFNQDLNTTDSPIFNQLNLTALIVGLSTGFVMSSKLTAGTSEIEGSNFDIDGGDLSAITISGGLTWNAPQNLNSQALTNVNIDSGSVDGATLGTNSAITEAQIDDLNFNGETISNTVVGGNIKLSPEYSGSNDGAVIINKSTSGATLTPTNYMLIIDSAADSAINILSPNNRIGGIVFGDADDVDVGAILYDHSDNHMYMRVNNSADEAITILSSGLVGIENSSPANLLQVGNSTRVGTTYISVDSASASQTGVEFRSAGVQKWVMYRPGSSTDIRWWDGSADRMRLVNGGAFYFSSGLGTTGTTSGHNALYINTSTWQVVRFTSGAHYKENYNRNFVDYENIYNLRACLFDEKKVDGEKDIIGFIADEFYEKFDFLINWKKLEDEEEIDLELITFLKTQNDVSFYKDGDILYKKYNDEQYIAESYDRSGLIPILVKTVQEQKAKQDAQQLLINDLTTRIEALEQ